jgi:hypothetical protein
MRELEGVEIKEEIERLISQADLPEAQDRIKSLANRLSELTRE